MNNRERFRAIMHYEDYDRMPVLDFGCWPETLDKWLAEGHITEEERYHAPTYHVMMKTKLGFDFGYHQLLGCQANVFPGFEHRVLETFPDGSYTQQNWQGLIEKHRTGAVSIPMTVGTLLTDRAAWEELYLPRMQWHPDRIDMQHLRHLVETQDEIDVPVSFHTGSLYGTFRDLVGVENLAYLYADDEELYAEVIDTIADIVYRNCKLVLELGLRPDFAHFWEDICFKNGPLVSPAVFEEYVAPHYKKVTDLLKQYGCDIVSLDCDGCIDKLLPIWLENGVNTMFPIEVGTWGASIGPWREQYGRKLRGVGGMNKLVLAEDYAAIDAEIERLRPLVAMGGFIPCPDHLLPPETKFETVQYYCEQIRKTFG